MQLFQPARPQANLFLQLTSRGELGGFVCIQGPGRELQQSAPGGRTPLAHEGNRAPGLQRQDDDRAAMLHDLPLPGAPIRQADFVSADLEDLAIVEALAAFDDLPEIVSGRRHASASRWRRRSRRSGSTWDSAGTRSRP